MVSDGQPLERVILSFGSNCGDRTVNITNALKWFESVAADCHFSSIYETPEIHGYGGPYMNAVASGFTGYDFESLNRLAKIYEIENGRNESCRLQGRVPIDIDIVLWNNETLRPQDFAREFFQIGFHEIQTAS